ncbi:MAG: LysR family transcriptional regulator [Polyangiaceae bacterium]
MGNTSPGVDLSLFDVRYFLAAVDAGSLHAGARRVHVTAAALTKALQRLEAALGVRLMHRGVQGSRLTAEGERLVGPMRALTDDAVRLASLARGTELASELTVLAMEVFSPYLLPSAVTALRREQPSVLTRTYESIPQRMVELVQSGRADVAFTIGSVESPAVKAVELGATRGVLVCGQAHPLAKQRTVTRADLARYPSVVPRFWGLEHLPSLDQFPDASWPRNVGATIELLRMAVSLAEEGEFLGYFPRISIRDELATGRLRALAGPPSTLFKLTALLPLSGARRAALRLVELVRARRERAGAR